jgi:hypothetical protein
MMLILSDEVGCASSAIYVYPTVRINLPVFHVAVTLKPWFPNTKQYWQSVGDGL